MQSQPTPPSSTHLFLISRFRFRVMTKVTRATPVVINAESPFIAPSLQKHSKQIHCCCIKQKQQAQHAEKLSKIIHSHRYRNNRSIREMDFGKQQTKTLSPGMISKIPKTIILPARMTPPIVMFEKSLNP